MKARSNIDYMLTTASQHHVALSSMADQKANIVIGTTFIMITLVVGQAHDKGTIPPALVALVLFSAAASLCALLAVTPRFHTPDPAKRNLLFFGHFAQMTEEEYLLAMKEKLSGDETTYEVWLRDLHQLGCALYHRKYRYLIWSYRLFFLGISSCMGISVADWLVN